MLISPTPNKASKKLLLVLITTLQAYQASLSPHPHAHKKPGGHFQLWQGDLLTVLRINTCRTLLVAVSCSLLFLFFFFKNHVIPLPLNIHLKHFFLPFPPCSSCNCYMSPEITNMLKSNSKSKPKKETTEIFDALVF